MKLSLVAYCRTIVVGKKITVELGENETYPIACGDKLTVKNWEVSGYKTVIVIVLLRATTVITVSILLQ